MKPERIILHAAWFLSTLFHGKIYDLPPARPPVHQPTNQDQQQVYAGVAHPTRAKSAIDRFEGLKYALWVGRVGSVMDSWPAAIMTSLEDCVMLFLTAEDGQGLVEYALLIALIALVVIVVLTLLGTQLGNVFSQILVCLPNVDGNCGA